MKSELTAARTTVIDDDQEKQWFKRQWADNHGNFLIAFVIGTVLVNALYVVYQRSKFVPPRFPDASVFDNQNQEAAASISARADSVNFRVIRARTIVGSVVIALYDSSDAFGDPGRALETWTVPLRDGVAIWSIAPEDLPEAFAAVAFHDENGDGTITQNSLGAAIERYGYTGDQRFVGPGELPSYADAVVQRPDVGGNVEIFIR